MKKRILEQDEYNGISPGAIGGLIMRIRRLRGMSRGKLGAMAGFGPSVSSEVRIRQYEVGINVPREDAKIALADALQINLHSLLNTDFSDADNMYHALFYMELFHALRPVKIGDCYYLEFGEKNGFNQAVDSIENRKFLEEWYNAIQSCKHCEIMGEEKSLDYAIWQYEYPCEFHAKEYSRAKVRKQLLEEKESLEKRLTKIKNFLDEKGENA